MLITHSRLFADHLEAVVLIPDVTADEGGLEAHHHVPAHGHDVALAPIGRAHQNDRPRFEEAPDFVDGEVFPGTGFHAGWLWLGVEQLVAGPTLP
jgi:hypothetical protein